MIQFTPADPWTFRANTDSTAVLYKQRMIIPSAGSSTRNWMGDPPTLTFGWAVTRKTATPVEVAVGIAVGLDVEEGEAVSVADEIGVVESVGGKETVGVRLDVAVGVLVSVAVAVGDGVQLDVEVGV